MWLRNNFRDFLANALRKNRDGFGTSRVYGSKTILFTN